MEVILSLIINILLWLPIFKVLNHPKSTEIDINRKVVSISFLLLFLLSASQIQTILESYF